MAGEGAIIGARLLSVARSMNENLSHKEAFKRLLDAADITQGRAAELIEEQTMRPCRVRTVRSWLADSSLPSARPCPEWAVKALKARLVALKLIADEKNGKTTRGRRH